MKGQATLGMTTRPWPPASLVVSILSNRNLALYSSTVPCVPFVRLPLLVLGAGAAGASPAGGDAAGAAGVGAAGAGPAAGASSLGASGIGASGLGASDEKSTFQEALRRQVYFGP